MNRLRSLVLALVAAVAGATAYAADVPFLTGRVNDHAGMLSLATAQHLDSLLRAHEDSTSNQVAVLTMSSLDGDDLEGFSIRVVDTWKLGQKGKDNGVLLLIVRDDRKVRIEVGRGLEGSLPDITCGTIIRKDVLPKFKAGDMDGGTIAGVESILAAIRGAYVAEEEDSSGVDDVVGRLIGCVVFFSVVGVFTLLGIAAPGFFGWFLYLFLIPFWFLFPTALIGEIPGFVLFGSYLLGYPAFKIWLRNFPAGKKFQKRLGMTSIGRSSSGGWSSSGGSSWSSSSGSSFSGGGGSFSGGGASGSW